MPLRVRVWSEPNPLGCLVWLTARAARSLVGPSELAPSPDASKSSFWWHSSPIRITSPITRGGKLTYEKTHKIPGISIQHATSPLYSDIVQMSAGLWSSKNMLLTWTGA